MARSSSFGWTNTTAGSNSVTQTKLKLTSNYALERDQADVVIMNNKTAPIDCEEIVSFRSRDIDKISTNLNIQYPTAVKGGIEYSVRVDATLSTTDTADPSYRVDEPMVCSVTFRHPKSGNITNTQVAALFGRAISALMEEDGTWRFADLMRSAERPVVD
jgi:hypothetical protein